MPHESNNPSLQYLDFELETGPGSGREYPVTVLHSPAGEARATMYFPFDQIALENRILKLKNALLLSGGKRRAYMTPNEQAVREFGQELFEALMTGEVRTLYEVSKVQARQRAMGLRLKLRFQSPELAALPWEYLFDPGEGDYLCLSNKTPVVRYLEVAQPPQPLAVPPPLRVLGMCASPSGLPELDFEREKGRIEKAVDTLCRQGLLKWTWLKGQDWRSLQVALRQESWHIFHFIGHGRYDQVTGEGQLALADDNGHLKPLGATALARLLANHPPLRLVFLNACEGTQASAHDPFSALATALVRRGLPAVLAMQHEITDQAATELGRVFYEALADGLPVDSALSEARLAISLAVTNSLEWGTPVLYLRAPDGVLFKFHPETHDSEEQPDITQPAPTLIPESLPSPDEITLSLAPEVDLRLVRVPSGEFLMGSDVNYDPGAQANEFHQHRVYLDEYFIGKYPVTNAQYRAFVAATQHPPPVQWTAGVFPKGKDHNPVVNISWNDALAFCQWASQVTGQLVRLPTEAEWEKAARGGLQIPVLSGSDDLRNNPLPGRIYPWGDEPPNKNLCNFSINVRSTTPVGQYSPQGDSLYGCADMAGNVWEWTGSLLAPYPYQAQDGREALDGEGKRVLRGGSFDFNPGVVRCSFRYGNQPDLHFVLIGFRVAMT